MSTSDTGTVYTVSKLQDPAVRNAFFGMEERRRTAPTSEHLYDMMQVVIRDISKVPELSDKSNYADFRKWHLRISVALRANKLGYLMVDLPTLGWELMASALIADICKTLLGNELVLELDERKLFLNELLEILAKKYPKKESKIPFLSA